MKLEKRYNYQRIEKKLYRFWLKKKFFRGEIVKGKKPFVITLPPPNVTGSLHTGHAMYTVEDILIRYHKLKGEPVLFLPGFDHASIALEYLVKKQLAKEGKRKKDVGRKEFLKRARKFAKESRKRIKEQLKRLGYALDWQREAYTMDKARSEAVKAAFQKLYKKGLIYKGKRMINWCPSCQSVISDLENEHKEEKGKLWYIKYPIKGSKNYITVATTRPETMLGDTAVAVNPTDRRYKKLIGKKVILPLLGREIPIIADKAVDKDFGTGAVKITPAHDFNDFEIGQRHHLPFITVIDFRNKMTKEAGSYAYLNVYEARKRIIEDLSSKGLLEKIETIIHSVGHCQRCGTITQPLVSEQWFVKIGPLAQKAIKAVKKGKIKIVPKRFEKIYFHWLENIKDWCISRQLWWGHKIPLKGEEDVLDTWFSSSLWPFSVFGWPKKTKDFRYFYPTSVRETGYDILFFWVAREIMMALEMTGKVPYRVVYLHGLVRDKQGRKFSKSKGIGFDPLEMIEKYGADALRMSLIVGNAPGNDLKIEEDKVRAYRNFANKVWNAARFILQVKPSSNRLVKKSLQREDKWILKELKKTEKRVAKLIEDYKLGLAGEEIYQFFWHKFCDKYIESVKERKKDASPVLLKVLKESLIILHPFMPFVTEAIYQKLPLAKESIFLEKWPSLHSK